MSQKATKFNQLRRRTVSLSDAIAQALEQRPELLDLLQNKFANTSAIAESLHLEMEALVGKRLTRSAVGMALRRQISRYSNSNQKAERMPAPFEISTRKGLYEIAIRKTASGRSAVGRIREAILETQWNQFSSMEGNYDIVILASQQNKGLIRRALKREHVMSEVDNIACVTANWAPNTKDIPGIYYRITQALALRMISIQSFHTIGSEMSIFVREDHLAEAHQALTRMLMG